MHVKSSLYVSLHIHKVAWLVVQRRGIDIPFKIKRDDTPTLDYLKSVKN